MTDIFIQAGATLVSGIAVIAAIKTDLAWLKRELSSHIRQDEERFKFLIERTGKEN